MSPIVAAAKAEFVADNGRSTIREVAARVLREAAARGDASPEAAVLLVDALTAQLVAFSRRRSP